MISDPVGKARSVVFTEQGRREAERLFRERLHLAMAADHALRDKPVIDPEDLRGENLLTLLPEYRMAEQVAAMRIVPG